MSNTIQTDDVIQLLKSHRSIRKFTKQKVPVDLIKQIVHAAQIASTSSHVQAYSIIGVTDQHKKDRLAELAGNQAYVADCGHFFVFCADLYRLQHVVASQDVEATSALNSTEKFIVATVDATLAAQNAAVAAESLGLGIVYIGGLRNEPEQVSDLLQLPHKVYPLFGMCVGYPDQDPQTKPRLPQEAIYFENEYAPFEQQIPHIRAYDETMKQYYTYRTNGKRTDTWSETVARMFQKPSRTHMLQFLQARGFPLE